MKQISVMLILSFFKDIFTRHKILGWQISSILTFHSALLAGIAVEKS